NRAKGSEEPVTNEPTTLVSNDNDDESVQEDVIESMQDELNQFKRLDVWELVERPADRNVIKVKWL
ncbi:hypothetical protein Tco_0074788, partial [Tanacetum coccineum]